MPANRLTQRRVDALKARKKVYDIRDGELRGFGVRVLPSGGNTTSSTRSSGAVEPGSASAMPMP